MEVGEPGFDTLSPVVETGIKALREGQTHYTHSMGLPELRRAITSWHARQYGTLIDPDCIVVTSGTSPAMLLTFMALCDPGDEVIISDPHYSCYPNLVSFAGGVPVRVAVRPEEGFSLTADAVAAAVTARTRAVVINSPSNPSGHVMNAASMRAIAELGFLVVSDEIYHGLVYEDRAHSMREITDRCVIVDGFSKLFAMTGWRLGYVIVPPELVRPVQKLQQNFFISAAHFGQTAAVTALSSVCEEGVAAMVREYDRRRLLLLDGLPAVGLRIAYRPTGAFYVFADAREYCRSSRLCSYDLAFDILNKAGVAVTPGSDFGEGGEGFLRFSYAAPYERLEEGLRRLGRYFRG
jgi:aspartate/methionine/tyrosine aminotransferase